MADQKTTATDKSVAEHLAALPNDQQRQDCEALAAILRRVTNQEPKMWGPTIIGFGSYRYTYASGRSGEACLAGFAARGREIVIYGATTLAQEDLLAQLGKHKMGKGCLYIRRLSDINPTILETMVTQSIAELERLYGKQAINP